MSKNNKNENVQGLTKALLWLLLIITSANAGLMGGAISNVILTKDQNPIIVEKTIIVPEGDSLVIGEGCMLFFRLFTGIQVLGKLIINGTADNPVCLTSQYDSLSPEKSDIVPNAGDWNGIEATESALCIKARYCKILYPASGIWLPKEILSLTSCYFSMCEKDNVTIAGKTLPVPDEQWYSRVVYRVQYNANGATGGSVPDDVNKYDEGTIVHVLSNSNGLIKNGYVFNGWSGNENGDGNSYMPGTSFQMAKNDVVFYAKWEKTAVNTTPVTPTLSNKSFLTNKVYLYSAGAGVSLIGCIVSSVVCSQYSNKFKTEFDYDSKVSLQKKWLATLITSIGTGSLAIVSGGLCAHSLLPAKEPDGKTAIKPSVTILQEEVQTSVVLEMKF